MTVSALRERVRTDILRQVHRNLSVPEFSRAALRILGRAVPFDGTCVLTMDPATLLPTGEIVENGLPPETMARLTEIEQQESDFNRFTSLARSSRGAASLSEATSGDLDRSIRQRELRRPNGFDDELRAVLADATGTWGAVTLMRATGRPHFMRSEVRFVASLTQLLADGVRRAALFDGLAAGEDGATGLVVLAPDNTIEMANQAADRWLDELHAGHSGALLPTAVRSVAARTRRIIRNRGVEAGDDATASIARARVRTANGRWVVVRGSLLGDRDGGTDEPRVAILLEAAGRPELAPLIADAYNLTERERRVTELVARGLATNEIAEQLHLSGYTIQDHLKSIFEKAGTNSRGDLVARIFFDHHVPQLSAATAEEAEGDLPP